MAGQLETFWSWDIRQGRATGWISAGGWWLVAGGIRGRGRGRSRGNRVDIGWWLVAGGWWYQGQG